MWFVKVDKHGNLIRSKSYGGRKEDIAKSIIVVDDGYLIAGYTASYAKYGYDFWLIKIDKYGNEIWNRKFGNRDEDTARSIVIDNAYIVGGSTNENGDRQGMLIKCYDYAYEPSIKITRPKKNYLYIFDREIMPYEETFIIGRITIIVGANDEEKRILEVGFYLTHYFFSPRWMLDDYEPRYVDYSPPYEWEWDEFAAGYFHEHTEMFL